MLARSVMRSVNPNVNPNGKCRTSPSRTVLNSPTFIAYVGSPVIERMASSEGSSEGNTLFPVESVVRSAPSGSGVPSINPGVPSEKRWLKLEYRGEKSMRSAPFGMRRASMCCASAASTAQKSVAARGQAHIRGRTRSARNKLVI